MTLAMAMNVEGFQEGGRWMEDHDVRTMKGYGHRLLHIDRPFCLLIVCLLFSFLVLGRSSIHASPIPHAISINKT